MSKHIVVIPSWYSAEGRGSGGGYFRDQALALQEAGHRVAMLVPEIYTVRDLRRGRVAAPNTTIQRDGVDIYRRARRMLVPRLPYRNALLWSLCGLRLFRDYTRRNGRPDLVHAHSCINAGVLAALIEARYGIPFLLTEHSTGFDQNRLRWWERDLVTRVARRAAARIAVSPHLAALLHERHGGDWHYIPNILGAAFLADAAGTPADATFTFISAARMAPVKNYPLLLDAFADAFAGDPGVRLVLTGDGPMRAALQQYSVERGIDRQVVFRGTLSAADLRAAMAAADAFVLSSDVESFGVVVIEAQAAGLPVICTASGGPDHLIEPSNGLLVPARDRAALSAALARMRDTAAGYDRVAIRTASRQRYGPETFVRHLGQIIEKISTH